MILFPNAKINLGLNIVGRRSDGYHNLETVFHPVDLFDILEMIPSSDNSLQFEITGLDIPGSKDENIVINAWRLLNREFGIPHVHIHLHKSIPLGAGLGGGSSDGAFAIKLLNNLFQLSLSSEMMEQFALQLGSDCPFFIRNRSVFATGRGEMLEDFTVDLSRYRIKFAFSGIHIETRRAYSLINPSQPAVGIREILQGPVENWKNNLVNDFEKPVFQLHPELRKMKDDLYASGALYASMTGSGSALYGIFPKVHA